MSTHSYTVSGPSLPFYRYTYIYHSYTVSGPSLPFYRYTYIYHSYTVSGPSLPFYRYTYIYHSYNSYTRWLLGQFDRLPNKFPLIWRWDQMYMKPMNDVYMYWGREVYSYNSLIQICHRDIGH